eukprot:1094954-Prorocentrum_minimum.AAC.1
MPEGADTYLHRVGRAGRFGTKGLAITFVASPEDSEVLNAVQVRAAPASHAFLPPFLSSYPRSQPQPQAREPHPQGKCARP